MSLKKALRNARRACNYEIGEPPPEVETPPAPAEPRPAVPIDGNRCYPIGIDMEVADGDEA